MVKSVVGAVLGGIAGAAIWAAVAFYAHLEAGYVAWGVGILTGLGAAIFADKKGGGGMPVGIMAAVVAAAAGV